MVVGWGFVCGRKSKRGRRKRERRDTITKGAGDDDGGPRARGTSKIDFDAPRRERPPSPASGDRWGGGVMMVGGDMLGRRGFLLYGHGEDGDGVGGCRRHGCFVLSRSYKWVSKVGLNVSEDVKLYEMLVPVVCLYMRGHLGVR